MSSTASRSDARRAVLLAVVAFAVYNANFRAISAGDCYPARFLPFAIWGSGTLSIEPVYDVARVDRENPFWIVRSDLGGRVSMYPVVTPVLVAPLYAPAVAYLRWTGWRTSDLITLGEAMEKLSASFIAALTVGLAYLLFRRGGPRRESTWLAVALAFGTNTWVTSSQALWQHGIGELLVVVALLLVTGSASDGKRFFALGAVSGFLAANRPPDVVLAAGFGTIVLLVAPRRAWIAALGAIAAYAPFAAYNWVHFHDLGGGYAAAFKATLGTVSRFFPNSVPEGLFGLLFSPGKGLLVFCPFLLFLALAAKPSVRARFDSRIALPLLAAVLVQLLFYAKSHWRGGASYGPRHLTDMLPILLWLLVPVMPTLRTAGRATFAVLLVWAIFCQGVGAFSYPMGSSDAGGPWRWSDPPMLVEARAGLAPSSLPVLLRQLGIGGID